MHFRKQFIYNELHSKATQNKITPETKHSTVEDLMNTSLKEMSIPDKADVLCSGSDLATNIDRVSMLSRQSIEDLLMSDKRSPEYITCALVTNYYHPDEKTTELGKNLLNEELSQLGKISEVGQELPWNILSGTQNNRNSSTYLYLLGMIGPDDRDVNINIYNILNNKDLLSSTENVGKEYFSLERNHSAFLDEISFVGCHITSSPETCREIFKAAGGKKLTSGQLGVILSCVVSDGRESKWNMGTLLEVIEDEMEVKINWNAVFRAMDNDFFKINSEYEFRKLSALLVKGCIDGDIKLTLSNIFSDWRNQQVQLEMIRHFINSRDIIDIVSYTNVLKIDSMRLPFTENSRANNIWASTDMMTCLLRISESPDPRLVDEVNKLLMYPAEYCPDLLFITIIHSNLVGWRNTLKMGLLVSLIRMFAKNKLYRSFLLYAMSLDQEIINAIKLGIEFAALSTPTLFEAIYFLTYDIEQLHEIRFSTNVPFTFHYNRISLKHDEFFTAKGWLLKCVGYYGIGILEKIIGYSNFLQKAADSGSDEVPQPLKVKKNDEFINLVVKGALNLTASHGYPKQNRMIKELFKIVEPSEEKVERRFTDEDLSAVNRGVEFMSTLKSRKLDSDEFIDRFYTLVKANDSVSQSVIRVFMTLLVDEIAALHRQPLAVIENIVCFMQGIYVRKILIEPYWSDIVRNLQTLAKLTDDKKFYSIIAAKYFINYTCIIDGGGIDYYKLNDYIGLILERSIVIDYPMSMIPPPQYVTEAFNLHVADDFSTSVINAFNAVNKDNIDAIAKTIFKDDDVPTRSMCAYIAHYVVWNKILASEIQNFPFYAALVRKWDRYEPGSESLVDFCIEETLKCRVATLVKVTESFNQVQLTKLAQWLGSLTIAMDYPLFGHYIDLVKSAQLLFTLPSGPLLNAHVVFIIEFLKCSLKSQLIYDNPNSFIITLMRILMLLEVKGKLSATVGLAIDSLCFILSGGKTHDFVKIKQAVKPEDELFGPHVQYYAKPLVLTKTVDIASGARTERPRTTRGPQLAPFGSWKNYLLIDEFVSNDQNIKRQLLLDIEFVVWELGEYYGKRICMTPSESSDIIDRTMSLGYVKNHCSSYLVRIIMSTFHNFYNVEPENVRYLAEQVVAFNWKTLEDAIRSSIFNYVSSNSFFADYGHRGYLQQQYRQGLRTTYQPDKAEGDRRRVSEMMKESLDKLECDPSIKLCFRQLITQLEGISLSNKSDVLSLVKQSLHTLFFYFKPNLLHNVENANKFMASLFTYLYKECPLYQNVQDNILNLLWEEDVSVRRNKDATLFLLSHIVRVADFDEHMYNCLSVSRADEFHYMVELDHFLKISMLSKPLLKSIGILKKYQEIPAAVTEFAIPPSEKFKIDTETHVFAKNLLTLLVELKVTFSCGYEYVISVIPPHFMNEFKVENFLYSFVYNSLVVCSQIGERLMVRYGRHSYNVFPSMFAVADALVMLFMALINSASAFGLTRGKSLICQIILSTFICALKSNMEFNFYTQSCYQRILIMLFKNVMNVMLGPDNTHTLAMFSRVLDDIQPIAFDSFAFSWLSIVSNPVINIRYMCTFHDMWWIYSIIIANGIKYTKTFSSYSDVRNVRPLTNYCRMVAKLLFMLAKTSPEFLSFYYMVLVSAVGTSVIHLIQYIISAIPRDITNQQLLSATTHPVIFLPRNDPITDKHGLKQQIDDYLNDKNASSFPAYLKETFIKHGRYSSYDWQLINAVMYYIGMSAMRLGDTTHHVYIIQNLLANFDYNGRCILIMALLNHVRYPNIHTEYYSSLIKHIFITCDNRDVCETILLIFLKRLVISKPHPIGFMELFVKLTSCTEYDRIKQPFSTELVDKSIEALRKLCSATLLEWEGSLK